MGSLGETHNFFNIKNQYFLFIHIPKTGGTSILQKIYSFLKIPEFQIQHKLASEYSYSTWHSYSFCVIRNPFDRLISHWKYHTTATDSILFQILGVQNYRELTFSQYFEIIEKFNSTVPNWKNMVEYISHPSFEKKIDTIIKFESIEEDWKKLPISKIIGETLPHIKKSEHLHYSKYYTPELIERVSNFYRKDLDEFKYCFEKIN